MSDQPQHGRTPAQHYARAELMIARDPEVALVHAMLALTGTLAAFAEQAEARHAQQVDALNTAVTHGFGSGR